MMTTTTALNRSNPTPADTINIARSSEWVFNPMGVVNAAHLTHVNPVTARNFVEDVVEINPARDPEKQHQWIQAAATVVRALPSEEEREDALKKILLQAGEMRRTAPKKAAVLDEIALEVVRQNFHAQ